MWTDRFDALDFFLSFFRTKIPCFCAFELRSGESLRKENFWEFRFFSWWAEIVFRSKTGKFLIDLE